MNLPHTLDEEFRRLARATGMTMEELVAEVAALTGFSQRHIYNFRSGKWPVPADLVPILYKRFSSTALLDELKDECQRTPVQIPDQFELTLLTSQTLREDLLHYERVLKAFEDGAIDARELAELRDSGARVVQNVRMFEAIAEADYERRKAARSAL